MNRGAEWILAFVAVVVVGAFVSGLSGGWPWFPGAPAGAAADDGYFHGGKAAPAAVADGGCRGAGCHAGMPHAKNQTQAAFRNMHLRFVGCLVCHGRESRKSWTVGPRAPASGTGGRDGGHPRGRWTLAVPTAPVDRGKPHALLGPPAGCRACHSEEGAREIGGKGAGDLPRGFADPVALRMIEEGAKQWIPDTMR